MSKRKLTRQQKWRIEKVQQERIARADKRAGKAEAAVDNGSLGSERVGTVVAHYGVQVEVEYEGLQRCRCLLRANIPSLVTGDKVTWRLGADNMGVIEAQHPRRSSLTRPDMRGQLKTVAANIDYIIIVIAPNPEPSQILIDRYLVAAEIAGIEPILLLNKTDLINEANQQAFNDLVKGYKQIGYKVLSCSALTKTGLNALDECLNQQAFVFVGQSGVGKSSLVNALLPESQQDTRPVSESSGLGVHTTTTARLFHTKNGGDLIDSPGIREFGLQVADNYTLANGFKEFREYIGHCQFRDCQHDKEPNCALKQAVSKGEVREERLRNFLKIAASLVADKHYK